MSTYSMMLYSWRNTTRRTGRWIGAATLGTVMLGGCYVVPIGPDGAPLYVVPPYAAPYGTSGTPVPMTGPAPATLPVRLYPANDLANQTGVLTGSVTNFMTGKGRFQFQYQGELLAGEATRVSGEERRGIANAYGPRGTYASCEYQLHSAHQGAGSCTFSNGAKYQVHIGT